MESSIGRYEPKTLGTKARIQYRIRKQERTLTMGKHKKNPRPKSSETISDPHYTEYDIQKERNIQVSNKPSHS